MIESDDAGVPGLHHPDFNAAAQSHFVEPADKMHVPIDIEDAPRLTRLKQMQGNDF
jgi:hypothetical protein